MSSHRKKNADNALSKSSFKNNPFGRLKDMVDREGLPRSLPAYKRPGKKKEAIPDPQFEEQFFQEAMAGVEPIDRDNVTVENIEIKPEEKSATPVENEALTWLVRLVDRGEGFIVSDTPEYIEGTGYNVRREFARRLHRGDYSIQAHIDLHGMNVEQAREAFDSFLKESMNSGKSAVLIIHGRGLSSPGEAILKNKVREWLGQSYWLKRIVAYASAQSHDGGAGATYVLLRKHPVSKKIGKGGK